VGIRIDRVSEIANIVYPFSIGGGSGKIIFFPSDDDGDFGLGLKEPLLPIITKLKDSEH
jgi:hypothetical protein